MQAEKNEQSGSSSQKPGIHPRPAMRMFLSRQSCDRPIHRCGQYVFGRRRIEPRLAKERSDFQQVGQFLIFRLRYGSNIYFIQ